MFSPAAWPSGSSISGRSRCFHCNGWCFPWTVALIVGTHVCLRWVRAKEIYAAIAEHKVTHLCGAPTVMAALLNAKPEERRPFSHKVNFVHAAASGSRSDGH